MIFKIKHKEIVEYAKAKDLVDLIKSYDDEYGIGSIVSISVITEAEAKMLPLKNTQYNGNNDMPPEIMLFDLCVGDDFAIVGSLRINLPLSWWQKK